VTVHARDGLVTVQPATGAIYDGSIDLQATFDGRYNTARLATTGSVKEVDVAAALRALEAGVTLTGTARAEWQLTSAGRTAEELVTGLTGPVNATVDQAVLEDLGVEKMLCEAVALVNRERMQAALPDSSHFRNLSMAITLGEGEARLKPLRAELPHLSLSGNGRLDLASKAFKSEFKARLSPGLGELDPACEVSKRLTSIDWPVECKGQITGDPGEWCAVDTEEIIEDLAKYEVQRKVEKKAGKLLDKLFD
jgi:AsmA protein